VGHEAYGAGATAEDTRQASENAQRGEITRAAQCFRLAALRTGKAMPGGDGKDVLTLLALRLGLGLRKCGRGPEHVLALKGPGILTPGPRLRPIKLAGLRDTAQETVRCEVQAVAVDLLPPGGVGQVRGDGRAVLRRRVHLPDAASVSEVGDAPVSGRRLRPGVREMALDLRGIDLSRRRR